MVVQYIQYDVAYFEFWN